MYIIDSYTGYTTLNLSCSVDVFSQDFSFLVAGELLSHLFELIIDTYIALIHVLNVYSYQAGRPMF